MNSISINQFQENLKSCVEEVVNTHAPIKVTRHNGDDFVVISADDWEKEQETIYILQNSSLMSQITDSFVTHTKAQGYKPSEEELNEITGL